jgi:hypothetical protein
MVKKKVTLALVVASFAALGLLQVGCGDDDSGNNNNQDSGSDAQATETGPGPGTDAGTDGGACKFNDFVTGLINNSTTATALPSTDLGDKCTDDQTLFPQTIF